METTEFLTHVREAILEAAEAGLARMHVRHYESAGETDVRQRLEALYDHVLDALRSRNLGPIVAYAEQVALERFEAGYDLSEVQTAFNALEEATWSRVFAGLQPTEFAEALGQQLQHAGSSHKALQAERLPSAQQPADPLQTAVLHEQPAQGEPADEASLGRAQHSAALSLTSSVLEEFGARPAAPRAHQMTC